MPDEGAQETFPFHFAIVFKSAKGKLMSCRDRGTMFASRVCRLSQSDSCDCNKTHKSEWWHPWVGFWVRIWVINKLAAWMRWPGASSECKFMRHLFMLVWVWLSWHQNSDLCYLVTLGIVLIVPLWILALGKDALCIHQSVLCPPHYRVVVGEDIWDLPKVRCFVVSLFEFFFLRVCYL